MLTPALTHTVQPFIKEGDVNKLHQELVAWGYFSDPQTFFDAITAVVLTCVPSPHLVLDHAAVIQHLQSYIMASFRHTDKETIRAGGTALPQLEVSLVHVLCDPQLSKHLLSCFSHSVRLQIHRQRAGHSCTTLCIMAT